MAKREHSEGCRHRSCRCDGRGCCTCGADAYNAGRLAGLEEARDILHGEREDIRGWEVDFDGGVAVIALDDVDAVLECRIKKAKGDSQ